MSLHVACRLAHMDVFGACGTICAPTVTCVSVLLFARDHMRTHSHLRECVIVCHSFVISILAISNYE